MTLEYSFLLVGEMGTRWSQALQRALLPLGKLSIMAEEEALRAITRSHYDAIVVDAGHVRDVVLIISHLRAKQPGARVVIATSSPTWQRAREALKTGAADYIRQSLDEKELHDKIKAVLELPPPSQPLE